MKACCLALTSPKPKDGFFPVLLAGGEDGKLWMVAFDTKQFISTS